MSNAERQRKFQRANPGYDRRRKARQRSSAKRALQWMKTEAMLAELVKQQQTVEATVQEPATKPMLMLPAPVQNPVMEQIEALKSAMKAQPVLSRLAPSSPHSR